MKIVSIANQKGGTGKTTTVVNLSAALARAGKRVLMVDLDPQASLSEYYFLPVQLADSDQTMYDALVDKSPVVPMEVGSCRDILPATIDLAAADLKLSSVLNRERLLSKFLRQFSSSYEYCLIDCSPSLGVLTINALTASHLVLVPVLPELLSERTVKLILNTINEIRESDLNPNIAVWRILATMYDSRLSHHKEVFEALSIKYKDVLYPYPVRSTTKYKDAVVGRGDISSLDSAQGQYWDALAAVLYGDGDSHA